jgi:hypothetical protein
MYVLHTNSKKGYVLFIRLIILCLTESKRTKLLHYFYTSIYIFTPLRATFKKIFCALLYLLVRLAI